MLAASLMRSGSIEHLILHGEVFVSAREKRPRKIRKAVITEAIFVVCYPASELVLDAV